MKKFDLHIHSTCSKHKIWGVDGLNSPQEIVDWAIKIGLNGIAITDHNTIKGGQKAVQYVKENDLPLLIIPGAEIRSSMGDILAFGINENVRPFLPILETIDAIQDQAGIAVAAHPFKYNTKMGAKLKDPSIHSRFDAIEVFNSNIRKTMNKKAARLVEDIGLPGVAGSDAHYIMNIGIGMTCLEIDNLSLEDIFKAIKSNNLELVCSYTPLRNIVSLYFRKLGQMFKRTFGKGNASCKG